MTGYPQAILPVDHVEPVPRPVRAVLGGQVVLDTTRGLYLWEWPFYPQFQVPVDDVDAAALIEEDPSPDPVARRSPPEPPDPAASRPPRATARRGETGLDHPRARRACTTNRPPSFVTPSGPLLAHPLTADATTAAADGSRSNATPSSTTRPLPRRTTTDPATAASMGQSPRDGCSSHRATPGRARASQSTRRPTPSRTGKGTRLETVNRR